MDLICLHTGPLAVNTLIVPICENKVFVVDPANCDFSHDRKALVSYLEENKLEPIAIVLTHGHFDHISGIPPIIEAYPSIPIAIHRADAKYLGEAAGEIQGLSLGQMGFTEFLPYVADLPDAKYFLQDEKSLADTFASLNFSDEIKTALKNWTVLHTPGHTPGSVCLYNEAESILISGDTLFYRSWGRTDLAGGNESRIHESISKIMSLCDENAKVYPGHERVNFLLKNTFN
ncbi:MAG: MBL fold metallo-hydrolase [Treponema sp.]|nr:MBL fold metallo-hydrolase [Treponema sp.]